MHRAKTPPASNCFELKDTQKGVKAYEADGTLAVAGDCVCKGVDAERDCAASAKNVSGVEIFSSIEKQTKVGVATEVVVGKRIERLITATTSLEFTEKAASRDVSATATLLSGAVIGNYKYVIRIDTKPATN